MDDDSNGDARPTVFGAPLSAAQVCIFPPVCNKADALSALVDAMARGVRVSNSELLRALVFEREAKGSTGLGHGVAIPHVRTAAVPHAALAVGVSSAGIDFDAQDGAPAHILILFATPDGGNDEYLALLRQVMISLRGTPLAERLRACETREAVLEALALPDVQG